MNNILGLVASKIAGQFEHPIYLNEVGEGFIRPSFFIYMIASKQAAINRYYYSRNHLVQIVFFANEDPYGVLDRATQSSVAEGLLSLFSSIRLEGIAIEDVFMDYTGDKDIFVQLELREEIKRPDETAGYVPAENLEIRR